LKARFFWLVQQKNTLLGALGYKQKGPRVEKETPGRADS